MNWSQKILNYTKKVQIKDETKTNIPFSSFPSVVTRLLDNVSDYDEKIDFEDLFQRSCSKTYLDWKSATMSLLSEIFEEPSNRMYLCFL